MEDRKDTNPEELENEDLEMSDAEVSEQESFESEESVLKDDVEETVAEIDTAEITEEIEAAKEEPAAAPARTKTVSAGGGSSALPKLFMLLVIILGLGAGLVYWKNNADHHGDDMSRVSKQEMELLLKDFNPMQLKQLAENPEQKKQLTNNLTELLAIASQAKKEGYDQKPEIKEELEGIESQILAVSYDRKINSDKGPMPPFGFISEDQLKQFWGENKEQSGISWIWNGAESRRREAEFQKFMNAKLDTARKSGQFTADQQPSEEEIKQLRDVFAKVQIYYKEAKNKLANLNSLPEAERKEWEEWKEKTELQIKLQKAQFLVQNYFQDVVSKKLAVTDEEVQKYMKEHPELTNTAEAKKKADEILKKINEGGDFAELAREFSEDPGSKSNGGLYEGITQGQFAPEFEKAVFSLKPGEVAKEPVKTNFGYHIIKLERLGEAKGNDGQPKPTYDARHILISTMVKDPENPMAQEMPAEQFVRTKLEKEKQEKMLAAIKQNNPIEIADFEVPKVSDEELQKMQEEQMKRMQQMQQQQQMPQQGPPKPEPEEAAPKKEEK
jgi:hypothetical protein